MSEFWGRVINGNSILDIKPTLGENVTVNRAALPSGSKEQPSTLYVKVDNQERVALTTLVWERNEQSELEIPLKAGSVVKFEVEGPNDIHITGYVATENDDDDDDDDDDEENHMQIDQLIKHQLAQELLEKKPVKNEEGEGISKKKRPTPSTDSTPPSKKQKKNDASSPGTPEKKDEKDEKKDQDKEKKEQKKDDKALTCPLCSNSKKFSPVGLEQHKKSKHSGDSATTTPSATPNTTPKKEAVSSETPPAKTQKKGETDKNKQETGKKKTKN